MDLDFLQYDFMLRGLLAGLLVAAVMPLIGVFLVLKRYSLIADTLSHVSLAGLAFALLFGLHPGLTAVGASAIAALGLERLRRGSVYGEVALAIFLSGSLALAAVIFSLARGFNTNLLNYLFGGVLTVSQNDIYLIAALGAVVAGVIIIFFKELVAVSYDEEAARVIGLPVKAINSGFILLAALTISMSIPVAGVLLIAALAVIPAITALRLQKRLFVTIVYAEIISVASVLGGIIVSFYLNLAAGGTIVLLMLAIFTAVSLGIKNNG